MIRLLQPYNDSFPQPYAKVNDVAARINTILQRLAFAKPPTFIWPSSTTLKAGKLRHELSRLVAIILVRAGHVQVTQPAQTGPTAPPAPPIITKPALPASTARVPANRPSILPARTPHVSARPRRTSAAADDDTDYGEFPDIDTLDLPVGSGSNEQGKKRDEHEDDAEDEAPPAPKRLKQATLCEFCLAAT